MKKHEVAIVDWWFHHITIFWLTFPAHPWCCEMLQRPVTDRDDEADGEEEEDQGRLDLHQPQNRGHG